MNIDVSKIENYESMTPEEKIAALEGYNFEEPATDNTDTLKLKEALNKASSQAAEFKRKLAEKQTEEERREAERIEQEKAKDELIATLTREKNLATLTKGFEKAGKYANDMASAFLDNKADTFAEAFAKFITDHDKELYAEALKNTPRPSSTGSGRSASVTKEQFDKMGYSERVQLKNDNPDLYNELHD